MSPKSTSFPLSFPRKAENALAFLHILLTSRKKTKGQICSACLIAIGGSSVWDYRVRSTLFGNWDSNSQQTCWSVSRIISNSDRPSVVFKKKGYRVLRENVFSEPGCIVKTEPS